MTNLLVICGPTASGKTAISIDTAKKRNGEIICSDSMQIYKYMNIGTAKPTPEEQDGVPHHLFGFVNPDISFSAADYATAAHECIKDVSSRGKLPILVGGTGLYIDIVINNIKLTETKTDPDLRARLLNDPDIYARLLAIDPKAAAKIAPSDTRRAARALEIYELTGITKSEQDAKSLETPKIYESEIICVNLPRELLYNRINQRVDIMIQQGLVDEVRNLPNLGATARQAIGYKEILKHLGGEITLEQAIDEIKINTRHYAKRQLTWFRKWIDK